jgi:hypothetical protein
MAAIDIGNWAASSESVALGVKVMRGVRVRVGVRVIVGVAVRVGPGVDVATWGCTGLRVARAAGTRVLTLSDSVPVDEAVGKAVGVGAGPNEQARLTTSHNTKEARTYFMAAV